MFQIFKFFKFSQFPYNFTSKIIHTITLRMHFLSRMRSIINFSFYKILNKITFSFISLYEICRSIRVVERSTNAACIKINERIRSVLHGRRSLEAMAGWWNAATWDEDKGWGRGRETGTFHARPGAESKQQIFYGLSSFFSVLLRHR